MVRTQVYLTEQEKNSLESVALSQGIPQSELIRQAIDDLLERLGTVDKSTALDSIAGIWSGREDIPDIRELRAGLRFVNSHSFNVMHGQLRHA